MVEDWREGFVKHLEELSAREDRAALATLRSGLRDKPENNLKAARYVYPWLPGNLHEAGVKNAFLIASLFSLHPLSGDAGSLGESIREIKASSGSVERRLISLVDADRETLPVHLRHLISLLRSKKVPVNWLGLLKDISAWDHPDKWVQRRWVSDFYRVKEETQ